MNNSEFLIVGIGASAGGIAALTAFFENVPVGSGMAYVVILHLSPDHDSKLAEVLQATSDMPVMRVAEKVALKPDCVYVIPPNKHLTIEDGWLAATTNVSIEDRRAPVDIFFRSLASAYGARAVGVILSGTGANGSMGIKRIKECGGAAFVQNPREAEFNEMPHNSIGTDLVDEVLPVAEIPAKLIAYRDGLLTLDISSAGEEHREDVQQALVEIFTQLRLYTGHDFTNYKRPTLLRRIERRINIRNLPNLSAYASYMHQHTEEITALLKDLLISVTNFFRDPKAFNVIETQVLPAIFRNKKPGEQVRIWVAGCATGEEAYSLAMLCAEIRLKMADPPPVQIFATDIDEKAIALAREGIYTINDAADVSPERLRHFFTKDGEAYRISREIRETILFALHNFIKDPPFSTVDMVSCRNVLIYLNHTAQQRVFETFHFALRPLGFLFLGSSESVDVTGELYEKYSPELHIFRRGQNSPRVVYPVPVSVRSFRLNDAPSSVPTLQHETQAPDDITFGDLHRRLIEAYAPPSLVVNEEFNIVHVSDNAGRYLQISGGEPSKNLLKLVRDEVRLELRSVLYLAMQRKAPVASRPLMVNIDGLPETIVLHIKPVLRNDESGKGFILVVFEPTGDAIKKQEIFSSDEPVARHLEGELLRIKAQLHASSQQHEFNAEELKASNEDLQAMNEELRSALEELETSKEELQSINEELRTVNQELKIKIEETNLSSNNLKNLINSSAVSTIFLDRRLRIALFTPAARDIFNLIPTDYGRELSDITNRLVYKDVLQDAKLVLEKLTIVAREVRTTDNRTFMLRMLPYRTKDDKIDGVVLTFFDISDRKLIEESKYYLAAIVESSQDAIISIDLDRNISSWNKSAEMLYGYKATETLGKPLQTLAIPEDSKQLLSNIDSILHGEEVLKYDTITINKDGKQMELEVAISAVKDSTGNIIGVSTIARDITKRTRAEEGLHASEERMRVTMESATDYAIMILDTNGDFTTWSKGAELIFGYSSAEAAGQHTSLIFTEEDRAAGEHERELKQAREYGRAMDERWHVRKDGSRLFMSGVMSPIINNGELIGYVKVARDATDRKVLEQQKDDFIGIASHELKTPVTSIKGYAELLLQVVEGSSDARSLEYIRDLNVQIDKLVFLIRNLLDTTKIAEGQFSLHSQQFDLCGLIQECINSMQHLSKKHSIVFQPSGEALIVADKERISQVIINLVSNAIKYSPGGGDVTITCTKTDSGIQVSVSDKGIGIPQEVQSKVFNRFFRVRNHELQNFPGMGLGLYISSGIILRHGGTISLKSAVNEGSVFYFSLPYDSTLKTGL